MADKKDDKASKGAKADKAPKPEKGDKAPQAAKADKAKKEREQAAEPRQSEAWQTPAGLPEHRQDVA